MARYSAIAAFWHWLTVVLILGQFYTGYVFHKVMERGTPERFEWFSYHAALGYLILIVALLRVATRLVKPAPRLPQELPAQERFWARASHLAIYACIVAIPLAGIVAVSDGKDQLELSFGLTLPVLPGISEAMADSVGDAHSIFVWVFAGLLIIHVLAALYHHGRGTAAAGRMWPTRP